MGLAKEDIIRELRKEILSLQGLKEASSEFPQDFGLSAINHVFPQGVFPTGAVHEITGLQAPAAAASGFLCFLLSRLVNRGEIAVWVSSQRTLFPPALTAFGIEPERIVFLDMQNDKAALWAIEEALKCDQLAAVVGEVRNLDFTSSRRLQLAVEKSKVTGFILRPAQSALVQNACISRWQIGTLPSGQPDGLPGVGNPRWQVELTKMRGGKTGSWIMEWNEQGVQIISPAADLDTAEGLKKIV